MDNKTVRYPKNTKTTNMLWFFLIILIPAFVTAQEADTYLTEKKTKIPEIVGPQNSDIDIADFNIESLLELETPKKSTPEKQKKGSEEIPEKIEEEPVQKPVESSVQESILEESMITEQADESIFLRLGKMHIYRFKPAERLNQQEINAYLRLIRQGGDYWNVDEMTHKTEILDGSELMAHISYHHLRRVMQILDRQGRVITRQDEVRVPDVFTPISTGEELLQKQFSHPLIIALVQEGEGVSEELRFKCIESMLGGLLNPDPRVRLITVNVLRRLIPLENTWDFINERIRDQEYGQIPNSLVSLDASYETVQNTIYEYSNVNQENTLKIVYAELVKLRRFISRFILVKQIQTGEESILRDMDPVVFQLLSQPIDNESFCRVPLNYLEDPLSTEVLIRGLENPDPKVQRSVVHSLLRILHTRNQDDNEVKVQIFNTLIEDPDIRQYILKGWSEEESYSLLSQEEKEILMSLYIKKNTAVKPCPKDIAKDLYDSRKDPIGFRTPKYTLLISDDMDVIEALMEWQRKNETIDTFDDDEREEGIDEERTLDRIKEASPIQENYILAP